MSTELAIHNDVDDLKRIGTMLAMSGYFETAPNPTVAVAQMCTKVMAGRELGFGPFASATGIHIIKGKPSIGANLMAAAVKAHPRYDYRVRKMADDIVSVEFFELEDGKRVSVGVSEFTAKDAQAAGTQNMGKFPRNMLFARAMSNGVRWYCPDVFLGSAVYVPEELGAEVDAETGEILQGGYTVAPQRPQEPPSAPPIQNGTPSTSMSDDAQFGDDGPDGPFANAPTNQAVPPMTDHQRKRMHALGAEVYGDKWEDKRHELVTAITKGRSESSSDLTDAEARRLISGLVAKQAQLAQPDAPKAAA